MPLWSISWFHRLLKTTLRGKNIILPILVVCKTPKARRSKPELQCRWFILHYFSPLVLVFLKSRAKVAGKHKWGLVYVVWSERPSSPPPTRSSFSSHILKTKQNKKTSQRESTMSYDDKLQPYNFYPLFLLTGEHRILLDSFMSVRKAVSFSLRFLPLIICTCLIALANW